MTPIWAPYGTIFTFRAPIIGLNTTNFTNSFPNTAGTVKVIQNGTVLGNITTNPVLVASQYVYTWTLSATEMATDEVIIQVVDRASATDQMFRIITAPDGAVRSRLAQAGSSSTITLDTNASASDSLYNGNIVAILAGTGVGQCRVITGYVGSTKVATVDSAWVTTPDTTSVFALYPQALIGLTSAQVTAAVPSVSQISAQVFDTEVVETGMTFRQSMRLTSAVLFGRRSGTGSGTEVFNAAVTNAKARVTGTIDGSGNRTNVTTDGT